MDSSILFLYLHGFYSLSLSSLFMSLREVRSCHPGGLYACEYPTPSFPPLAAAFKILKQNSGGPTLLWVKTWFSGVLNNRWGSMFIWRGWGKRQVKSQELWMDKCSLVDRESSWKWKQDSSHHQKTCYKWWINKSGSKPILSSSSSFLSSLPPPFSSSHFPPFLTPPPIGLCNHFGESIVDQKVTVKLVSESSSLCEPLWQPFSS